MAKLYDLMLLVDPNVPEDRQSAVVSEVEQMISSGGELVGTHDWGTRRLAFEIDHRPEADYRLYQFNGERELLERLQQRLRIMDGVLRFRIIRLKPGSPPPPAPRDHAPPRPREEREREREREPEGRVAARAAADAPPPGAPEADAPPADDAPAGDAAPADAPPAESPAP
jgi:small subunit ribosomal protein S6